MMRIKRHNDLIDLIGVVPNKLSYALDVLLCPWHEQGSSGMTEINLGVNNQKGIFHRLYGYVAF